jgi:hypothetical protein
MYCGVLQRGAACVCVCCVLCIVFCVLCIVYCVLCIVYCVLCIVYRVSCCFVEFVSFFEVVVMLNVEWYFGKDIDKSSNTDAQGHAKAKLVLGCSCLVGPSQTPPVVRKKPY